MPLVDPDELPEVVNDLTREGDMVVCLGAGNITQWAGALPERLRKLRYSGQGKDKGAGE